MRLSTWPAMYTVGSQARYAACECGPITRAGRSLGRSCAIAQCPAALLRPALGSDAVVGCLPLIRSTTARIAQSVRGRSIGQGRVRADSRAWELARAALWKGRGATGFAL